MIDYLGICWFGIRLDLICCCFRCDLLSLVVCYFLLVCCFVIACVLVECCFWVVCYVFYS